MSKFLHLVTLLAKLNPDLCWWFPSAEQPSKCGGLFLLRTLGTTWNLSAAHPKDVDFLFLAHAIKLDVLRRGWAIQYVSFDLNDEPSRFTWTARIERLKPKYVGWGEDDNEAIAILEAYCRCLNSGGVVAGQPSLMLAGGHQRAHN